MFEDINSHRIVNPVVNSINLIQEEQSTRNEYLKKKQLELEKISVGENNLSEIFLPSTGKSACNFQPRYKNSLLIRLLH